MKGARSLGFPLVVVITNTAAAVMNTLLYGWFEQRFDARELRHVLATGLVYSFSIGTPAAFAMPVVLRRVANRPTAVRLLAVVAAVLLAAVAGCVFTTEVLAVTGAYPHAWHEIGFVLRICLVVAAALGIGVFFFENLFARLREQQIDAERARKLAAEAQVAALQARVHPHFLFNTLNSISSLIPDDPARAEELIGRFSALLRRSLNTDPHNLVPLAQELQIARDYLEIERARCGERLHWSFTIDPDLNDIEVPLLAVQCLVENSVRHAIAPAPDGGDIVVAARRAQPGVTLEIEDSDPGFRLDDAPPGHAVNNLALRLKTMFGPAAVLETERRNGRFLVRVRVPA